MLGWHQSLISVRLDPFFRSSPIWEIFQWSSHLLGKPCWESHFSWTLWQVFAESTVPGFGQKMEPELQNWCSSKGGELGEYEGSGRKFSAFFWPRPVHLFGTKHHRTLLQICSSYIGVLCSAEEHLLYYAVGATVLLLTAMALAVVDGKCIHQTIQLIAHLHHHFHLFCHFCRFHHLSQFRSFTFCLF